ncbi:hypothetical protein BpHYR1_017713 [Brachionus plicatilis]|uniref:Uncharacterized protein n=1 Tax=Brachionus plicatilis TaxID=10195 RepID=A0A3M7PS38_BRAPC|nr:hypothetical protein BpHYR1_017713 [Brachionus plicatilis]
MVPNDNILCYHIITLSTRPFICNVVVVAAVTHAILSMNCENQILIRSEKLFKIFMISSKNGQKN